MRLVTLSAHIPQFFVPVQQLVENTGCSLMEAKVFSRLYGMNTVSAYSEMEPPFRAIHEIINNSFRCLGALPVDTFIYVHAFPLQSTENQNIIDELKNTIPALNCIHNFYEVDQHNCAGAFWALSMAHSLLVQGFSKRILVLIGDNFLKLNHEHRYVPGCTVMADGYVSLVLDLLPGNWQVETIFNHHYSEFHQGLYGDELQNKAFYRFHNTMVNNALDALNYYQDPHTGILPHNVNKISWLNYAHSFPEIGKRLDLSLLPHIGHCCAADPFILLNRHFQAPAKEAQKWALLSIGSGGYVGACSITYMPKLKL